MLEQLFIFIYFLLFKNVFSNIETDFHDVKTTREEEMKKYPQILNLWKSKSWWSKISASRFKSVMKQPLQLFITKELIPQIYFNAVRPTLNNTRESLTKSGIIQEHAEKDNIIAQVISELSEKVKINVNPPEKLVNRIFKVIFNLFFHARKRKIIFLIFEYFQKLFVPNEKGYITKEEFVNKFLLVANPGENKDQLLRAIFDMIDEEGQGSISFSSLVSLSKEIAETMREFAPRLIDDVTEEIKRTILEKIYLRVDKNGFIQPGQDIPNNIFTILTSDFSHKNASLDWFSKFLNPKTLNEAIEIFQQNSVSRIIGESKVRVVEKEEFKKCLEKIIDFEIIVEEVITFVLGGNSEDLREYKRNAYDLLKEDSGEVFDIAWNLVNTDKQEFVTQEQFSTFLSIFFTSKGSSKEDQEDMEEEGSLFLAKSHKRVFLAKNTGSELGTARRITRMLEKKGEEYISSRKLDYLISVVLAFFSTVIKSLAESISSPQTVEKNLVNWFKEKFEVHDDKLRELNINFPLFKEKLGGTIFSSLSKFIRKIKD